MLGFSYVFSWISAFIGLTVRDPETAQSAGFIWVFPLTFASSAFVPTSSMPGVPWPSGRSAGRERPPAAAAAAGVRPRT